MIKAPRLKFPPYSYIHKIIKSGGYREIRLFKVLDLLVGRLSINEDSNGTILFDLMDKKFIIDGYTRGAETGKGYSQLKKYIQKLYNDMFASLLIDRSYQWKDET